MFQYNAVGYVQVSNYWTLIIWGLFYPTDTNNVAYLIPLAPTMGLVLLPPTQSMKVILYHWHQQFGVILRFHWHQQFWVNFTPIDTNNLEFILIPLTPMAWGLIYPIDTNNGTCFASNDTRNWASFISLANHWRLILLLLTQVIWDSFCFHWHTLFQGFILSFWNQLFGVIFACTDTNDLTFILLQF